MECGSDAHRGRFARCCGLRKHSQDEPTSSRTRRVTAVPADEPPTSRGFVRLRIPRPTHHLTPLNNLQPVDTAVVGLVGTVVGAVAAVGGSFMAGVLQSRRDRLAFGRTRKADAYAQAVEHLFRAATRRSELTAEGKPILAKQDQREWFLDLGGGLQSLTAVVAYADPGWRHELAGVLQRYGMAVWKVTQEGLDVPEAARVPEGPYGGLRPFSRDDEWSGDVTKTLWVAAIRVQQIATLDLAGYASGEAAREALGSRRPED